MTLQDLKCFVTVAETLSYTQTAQRLYISQPAVTKHIAALEKEYQVSLINRSNRRQISMTEAGKILYDGLKSCLETYHTAVSKLKAYSLETPIITNLSKGITLPFQYIRQYNDFAELVAPSRVSLDYRDYADFSRCLDCGELIICEEEAIPADKKYQKQLLSGEVPHCIIASSGHPVVAAKRNPAPEDFVGSPVLFNKKMPERLLEKYLSYLTKLYGHEPENILYTESIESVGLYLHANRAITLCSEWYGMLLDANKYHVTVPLHSAYYLVWDAEKAACRQVEKLCSILKHENP